MSEQRILVVEAAETEANRILAGLEQAHHTAVAVPNCAEAAEALMLQRFDAVLLGSGQPEAEIAELAGCVHGSGQNTLLLAYTDEGAGVADRKLARDFDAAQLEDALHTGPGAGSGAETDGMPVFEPEQFAEQCADETSLMIEIIDLFEAERGEQMAAMAQALAAGDFDRLSKIAHTLKGSVGALHAPVARNTCQAIELAARERNTASCEAQLNRLEQNLADLEEPLREFKQRCQEA